jgi:hypothetical protein
MIWLKIQLLKLKLWQEMRPLSSNQKKQLKERIWWDFEDTEDPIRKMFLRIYAAQLYKEKVKQRFE